MTQKNKTNIKLERKVDFNCNAKFLIVVLDGVGFLDEKNNINFHIHKNSGILPSAPFVYGNSVNAAYTPNLFQLYSSPLFRTLKAHGTAVGLPSDDDMGNSEVGHNALGSGRIFAQGAKLVNAAIESGAIYNGATWKKIVEREELKNGKNVLHFCGILSDGNVHSHINHLFALVEGSKKSAVKNVRLHLLLDGRDVSPLSALDYVDKLEKFLTSINDATFNCQIASGGGRTFVTMDRYESDWTIVERGYNAHVLGDARTFDSITNAIETFRKEGNYFDQDLPPFVIVKNTRPVGLVEDNDSFILFNFRGDRAIEISRALTEENFSGFVRKRFPKIFYAGMMQYDGDLKIPENYLVTPPAIDNTMTELLSAQGVKQFACSETQKFGHVTYFWNGNRSEKFNCDLENHIEIPSDKIPFSQRPWMKCAEIADATIEQMKNNGFQIGRINFANGDMVGHTGDFAASIVSMGAVDLSLGRIMQAAKETNTVLFVTADHGNADEMFEIDKKNKKISYDKNGTPKQKTSHTLSPVPFAIYNSEALPYKIELCSNLPNAGIANIAATVLELAGFQAPAFYEPSLVQIIEKESYKKKVTSKLNYYPQNPDKRFLLAQNSLFFADTIAHLRAEDGCPWDKEQTFLTLKKYLIEEAYETVHAAEKIDLKNLNKENVADFCEELGDVLLQVFLNAQIAVENKLFDVSDVFAAINTKMISRHPHVFSENNEKLNSSSDVLTQWEKNKIKEKKETGKMISLLSKSVKKMHLPSLNYATEVSNAAFQLGFSWPTLKQVFHDIELEVQELKQEIESNFLDKNKIADEVGDIVFSVANFVNFIKVSQKYDLDFDSIVRHAVDKFATRFYEMEKIIFEKGSLLTEEAAKQLSLEKWNDLWKEAKKRTGQK